MTDRFQSADRHARAHSWRAPISATLVLLTVAAAAGCIHLLVGRAAAANERAIAAQAALGYANELEAIEARVRAGEPMTASAIHATAMSLSVAVDEAFGHPPRQEVAELVRRVGLFCDVAVATAGSSPSVARDKELVLMDPAAVGAFTGDVGQLFAQVNSDLKLVAAEARADGRQATRFAQVSAAAIVVVTLAGLAIAFLFMRRKHRERIAQQASQRAELRFQALVSRAPDLLLVVDDRGLRYASPSMERLLGVERGSLTLDRLKDFMTPDGRVAFNAAIGSTRDRAVETTVTVELTNVEGQARQIEAIISDHRDDPHLRAIVLNARDVTERENLQRRLQYEATHDPLTGLANRRAFEARLNESIARSASDPDRYTALLLFDLDGFKGVNDSLGHGVGDRVLQEYGRRLANLARADEAVARLGGDEFAVVIEGVSSVEEAEAAARRLERAAWDPIAAGDELLAVNACGGLALAGTDIETSELMRRADSALFRAKRHDRGHVLTYDAEHEGDGLDTAVLRKELALAVHNGELSVAYQPVVDARSGRLKSCEVLARWVHPSLGVIGPNRFIPIAERSDLIVMLGHLVRDKACAQLAEWRRDYESAFDLSLSLNASVRELLHSAFVDQLIETVERYGLRPHDLIVEVTEHEIDNSVDRVAAVLDELRAHGFRLALDDFGVAPTSIQQLQHLRVDFLKVDRSLMAGVGERDHRDELIQALVGFAERLGLRVVVEGVETDRQLAGAIEAGCHELQGYHIAPADGPDAVISLFTRPWTAELQLGAVAD